MNRIFIAVCAVLIFSGCGNGDNNSDRRDGFSQNASSPEDSLFQEVMEGHDSAMAKMGKLSGYRKMMEQKVDSLKKKGPAAKAALIKKYDDLRERIMEAEDGMNNWMQEFSIDSAADNMEKRLQYLAHEKLKVDSVKQKIFSAIEKTDSLLRSGTAEK